jgi:hypothetical protein
MASKLDDQVGRVIKPAEWADTPRSILVKTYTAKQGEATALFQADCIEMANQAYFPTWQIWTPGEWARETYIFAFLLIPLFGIGILRLAYLLIVEPNGTLTVTYERRAESKQASPRFSPPQWVGYRPVLSPSAPSAE